MLKDYEYDILKPINLSTFIDDLENQILSPLSYLREFGTYWLLEFDLPLVQKKDIKVALDGKMLSIEAKLKETYSEEKLGKKTQFQFFKKAISLPQNINDKKIIAKFEKGRLSIKIPKSKVGHKIKVD